ncbi:hypothetical protein Y032_0143g2361 [Ancylostoma ceylanicum]|uniref:MTOR-associated protein MEAK7 n=2 Tax=Ancylostoma ceylanicum TaxID=53326 RepID=A0A016T2Z0_9BILA|nr:hypothetical protein Y032_0143g2361 [Ancylostoma ceylanicum]
MGADASKSTKKLEISHLSGDQVRTTEQELEKVTKGHVSLEKSQFEKVYAKLRPKTSAVFEAIQHDNRCLFSSILQLADGLLGDASGQSAALLKIFGSTAQALAGVVSIYAHRHHLNANDSAALLDYLMLDAPSDDARFDRWLLGNSVAAQLVLHVFSPLVFEEGPALHPFTASPSSILTHSGAMIINMQLPSDRRRDWTLLFSSILNGSSFSQMSKRVNGEGPCLVVVESTNGRIFGCFASAGFFMGSTYHGDATSFLFEIKPHIRVYSATGLTQNYAYLNCQQASMPNGLGIGGYEEVWPFFIHEDYGKGTTLANISSFEKCHLAGSDHFEIKNIEVWRVGEKPRLPIEEEECIRSEKSILDKDPQAQALLEMSGRKMHSEAYRDPAPLLDEPFEIHPKHDL